MDILQINEQPLVDMSIEQYEYHEYSPDTGININRSGEEIIIDIQCQDKFFHPSKSSLLFEGQLIKTDDSLYTNDDVVTLINNSIMYL